MEKRERTELLNRLRKASATETHELLLAAIDYYNVVGLNEISDTQLREFAEMVGA